MTWEKAARAVITAAGAAAGFLWGKADGLFWAVAAVMAIDYVTGVLAAAVKRELSSRVGFAGIVKKVFILALMAVGHIIDAQVIGKGAAVMTAVQFFFLANEGISIIENAAALGLPVPKKLREALAQLRDKDGKEDN